MPVVCIEVRRRGGRALIAASVAIAVMTAGACADPAEKTGSSPPKAQPGSAPRVISGRATVVDGDGHEIGGAKIRLFGVDAPEIDQYCHRDDRTRWRCGHYASVELDRLVASHEVACTVRTVDQYDRPVAVCAAQCAWHERCQISAKPSKGSAHAGQTASLGRH